MTYKSSSAIPFRHLTRGQSETDEQAFTDAVYRTNQAFEGSIKEAYRVLTGKSPAKKTPFEIENYLEQERVFKPCVLAQFTAYRTEWRNPSTHDYTLAFDESESFLAITSVSAFACLLIDQIAERIAFQQASSNAKSQPSPAALPDDNEPASLGEIVVGYLAVFNKISLTLPIHTEAQLTGAIQGFLSSVAPQLTVSAEATLAPGRPEKADLLVSYKDDKAIVELRRSNTRGAVRQGLLHLEHAMALTGIKNAVLYLYYPAAGKMVIYQRPFMKGCVQLLVPIAHEDEAAGKTVEPPAGEGGSNAT